MAGKKSRRWSRNCAARRSRPFTRALASLPSKRRRAWAQALDVKVKTIDKFENLDHGLWQGMLVADVKAKQPKVYRQWQEQPENVCPPQGETLCAAKQRVSAALTKLAEETQVRRRVRGGRAGAAGERDSQRGAARRLGRFWHSATDKPHWQLIEMPETAAAK